MKALKFWNLKTLNFGNVKALKSGNIETCLTNEQGARLKKSASQMNPRKLSTTPNQRPQKKTKKYHTNTFKPQSRRHRNSPRNGKYGRNKQSKHHRRVLHFMWSSTAPAARPKTTFQIEKNKNPTSNQDSETSPKNCPSHLNSVP